MMSATEEFNFSKEVYHPETQMVTRGVQTKTEPPLLVHTKTHQPLLVLPKISSTKFARPGFMASVRNINDFAFAKETDLKCKITESSAQDGKISGRRQVVHTKILPTETLSGDKGVVKFKPSSSAGPLSPFYQFSYKLSIKEPYQDRPRLTRTYTYPVCAQDTGAIKEGPNPVQKSGGNVEEKPVQKMGENIGGIIKENPVQKLGEHVGEKQVDTKNITIRMKDIRAQYQDSHRPKHTVYRFVVSNTKQLKNRPLGFVNISSQIMPHKIYRKEKYEELLKPVTPKDVKTNIMPKKEVNSHEGGAKKQHLDYKGSTRIEQSQTQASENVYFHNVNYCDPEKTNMIEDWLSKMDF